MVENAHVAKKKFLQFLDIVWILGIEKITEIEQIVNVIQGSAQMTRAKKVEIRYVYQEDSGVAFLS